MVTVFLFFFFNDTATTEIYTLSLHDALPIFAAIPSEATVRLTWSASPESDVAAYIVYRAAAGRAFERSEEHTSELQSQSNLVCRLLLEKKKNAGREGYHGMNALASALPTPAN